MYIRNEFKQCRLVFIGSVFFQGQLKVHSLCCGINR